MMLVSNIADFKVETIELNDERYYEAINNIKDNKMQDKIIIHHDDALEFDCNSLVLKKYDCLFIDAAKAQYQKFFEKFIGLVKDEYDVTYYHVGDGICVIRKRVA